MSQQKRTAGPFLFDKGQVILLEGDIFDIITVERTWGGIMDKILVVEDNKIVNTTLA